MKQTPEDRKFARDFARALQPHVTGEQDKGRSLAEIAKELGVTAAGLQKQMAGGTPSIRTIAYAHAIYGVSVPYGDVEVTKAMSSKRKRKSGQTSEQQLFLPLEITAPASYKGLLLKPVPKSTRRYRLQFTVGVSA
jgi:transcriptional regulator with XRE-family HTH domain